MRRDHGEVMAAVSNLNEASANIGGDIVTSPMKENNYLSCTVFRMSALLGYVGAVRISSASGPWGRWLLTGGGAQAGAAVGVCVGGPVGAVAGGAVV